MTQDTEGQPARPSIDRDGAPPPISLGSLSNHRRNITEDQNKSFTNAQSPRSPSAIPVLVSRKVSAQRLATLATLTGSANTTPNTWLADDFIFTSPKFTGIGSSFETPPFATPPDVGPGMQLPEIPQEEVESEKSKEERAKAKDEKLYHALKEFLETEEWYVEDLRCLIEVYIRELRKLPFVDEGSLKLVRRNLPRVRDFHERLELALKPMTKEVMLGFTDGPRVRALVKNVASVFIKESAGLEVYDVFCARHDEALTAIRTSESHRVEWEPFEARCSAEITSRASGLAHGSKSTTNLSKLRFQDYVVKPVQRICRFPMLWGQLAKIYAQVADEADEDGVKVVNKALSCAQRAAEKVDEAKKKREIELRTLIIVDRMDLQSNAQPAFMSLLGQCQLVGSLHVTYQKLSPFSPPTVTIAPKPKYNGVLLFPTHLLIVKVRKTKSYEPKHWFPLKVFTLDDVEDGDGILPFSFRLSYQGNCFEFAASGPQEKAVWLNHLRTCITAASVASSAETLVSSVAISSPDKSQLIIAPAMPPRIAADPVFPSLDDERAFDSLSALPPQVISRIPVAKSRLSQATFSILARVPAAQRQAIDMRLADVMSDECLAARAEYVREMGLAAIAATSANVPAAGRSRASSASDAGRASSVMPVAPRTAARSFDTRRASEPDPGAGASPKSEDGMKMKWRASLRRSRTGYSIRECTYDDEPRRPRLNPSWTSTRPSTVRPTLSQASFGTDAGGDVDGLSNGGDVQRNLSTSSRASRVSLLPGGATSSEGQHGTPASSIAPTPVDVLDPSAFGVKSYGQVLSEGVGSILSTLTRGKSFSRPVSALDNHSQLLPSPMISTSPCVTDLPLEFGTHSTQARRPRKMSLDMMNPAAWRGESQRSKRAQVKGYSAPPVPPKVEEGRGHRRDGSGSSLNCYLQQNYFGPEAADTVPPATSTASLPPSSTTDRAFLAPSPEPDPPRSGRSSAMGSHNKSLKRRPSIKSFFTRMTPLTPMPQHGKDAA